MENLYLDANAHIPMSAKALVACEQFHASDAAHGHASSPSMIGRAAASALEEARGKIASLIGAKKPSQIIFTSGCTQAAEWALDMFFKAGEKTSIATSPVEHPAVKDPIEEYQTKNVNSINYLKINQAGEVLCGEQYNTYGKVCCIHLQNEIGTIQPIETLSKRSYVFSDMSQSLGKIPINVTEIDMAIAIFAAHKFGGPGNFGFIYLRDADDWKSFGTGSRYGLDRPGTPDIASAVMTAAALEEALVTLKSRTDNMIAFQSTLESGLDRMGLEVIGKNGKRSPNTTFVNIPEKGLYSLIKLGEYGIHVGLGSACGGITPAPSKIMSALGRSESSHDFVRISHWGNYREEEARIVLKNLEEILCH